MIHSIGRTERKKVWEAITRQTILDAAVRVISKGGVEGLKMESVAHEAGVAKGTLYQYFKNKEDLLRSTLKASVGPLFETLDSIFKSPSSPREKIEKFIYTHLGYFDDRRQLFRILIYDRHIVQSRCKRYGSELYRSSLNHLASVLKEGMEAGEFREMNALSLAAILMEANIAMINQRLLSEHPASITDDCKLVQNAFFQGILTRR